MLDAAPLVLVFLLLVAAALLAPLIPVRRRRTRGLSGFPVITVGLIVVNIFLFAANAGTYTDPNGNPFVSIAPDVARHFGMIPRSASVITLFTHMFLHSSWEHVLGNMLGLYLFGPHVEEALGRLEYFLFYIAAGIASALSYLVITATLMPGDAFTPLIGASGAIFGVLGLFAIRFWRTRVRVLLFIKVPAIWAMGAFGLLQVILGIASVANNGSGDKTANWAHVGGFLFGILVAFPLKMREDSRQEYALEDAEKAAAAGELELAAVHYRELLESSPADAASHYALGNICIRLKQADAAHHHLHEALVLYFRADDSRSVAAVYAEAVAAFSAFPLAPYLLQRVASACEETFQFPLAQFALAELCRDHAESKEAEMGLIRLGKLHLQKLGQPENAVGIFSEFLRIYPDSEWAGHAMRLRDEAAAMVR